MIDADALKEAIGQHDESQGLEHWHYATGGRTAPTERAGVFVDRGEVLALIDRLPEPARTAEDPRVAALEALFDLQQTRMERARAVWQLVEGDEDTWPDLGRLLDFLLAHADVDSLARALHETKGGGPFGIEGDCECEALVRAALSEASSDQPVDRVRESGGDDNAR